MEIKWHGHSCFSLRLENGYTIVFDPHDGGSLGLPAPDVKADLVLVTHDHFDHNAVETVSGDKTRVMKMFNGVAEFDGIMVEGLETYHDKYGGKRRGSNTVYIVEAEGLRVAHLGDIGHMPGEDILARLESLDILFVPVGGVYTIAPDEAWFIVERIKPRITVPMHYWVHGLILPLYRVEDFLAYVKKVRVHRINSDGFRVSAENLPREPAIYILRPPGETTGRD